MPSYRTPLGRVRGLGAAKHGVGHFITQRVTGAALIVLILWVIAVALGLGMSHADFQTTTIWLHSPWNAIPASLLIGVAFLHMNLGMRTIIEDYIQDPAGKIAFLLLSLFLCWTGGAIGVFSILKVAFGGGAH